MMAKRKPSKLKESKFVPLFIVEGCTETHYIKLLNKLFSPKILPKPHNCKGGSAKAILHEAEKQIEEDNYSSYVVIFDADTYKIEDKTKKYELELKKEVYILVFEPCFENWLLSHFEKQKSTHKKCEEYENELEKYIPKYDKNDCVLIEKFVTKDKIEFAMKNHVEVAKVFKRYYAMNN
jgi:hypothetical protein